MPSATPYLPPHLVQRLRAGSPERFPHLERFEAALLFSDISGFTALTERLQTGGRRGAEEIAAVINRVFRPAIRSIERFNGSIACFGGDALFVVFPGASAVERAMGAAEAVRESVSLKGKLRHSSGRIALNVSQAVHFGMVRGLHLRAGTRRHYLVVGPPVSAVARLQGKAAVGEIRVSAIARRHLAAEEPLGSIERPSRPAPWGDVGAYLDPRLFRSLSEFRGQFRTTAVLFLESKGVAARGLQGLVQRAGSRARDLRRSTVEVRHLGRRRQVDLRVRHSAGPRAQL